jgi:hypothetical protein
MVAQKFVFLSAVLLFTSGASMARAQDTATTNSNSQSLGDAARKVRAQKKETSKPAKVFTNDDLGGLKGTISVVGNQPSPETGTDKAPDKTEAKKPEDGKKDEASWRAKFAEARKLLAEDTKELDILQREYSLKQEQFYQDPNAALKQQYSRSDLDKTQSQIEAKKQAVEKDKQALSDLEDDLRKSGGDAGWANEPSGTSSSDSNSSGSGTSGASAPN